jgi:SagB-type dehydrogenase family enzyme
LDNDPLTTKENDSVELPQYSWAARGFHRISSFDHFESPAQVDLEAPVDSTAEDAATPDGVSSLLRIKLYDAIVRRSSIRNYAATPCDLENVNALLWAANGVVDVSQGFERRACPSAGGVYPLRLVVLAQSVRNLSPGIFNYDPTLRELQRLSIEPPDDTAEWFRTHHVDLAAASAVVFIVGDLERLCSRYGERGYRYLLLEAGHVGQNLCLAAESLGLSGVPLGGFDDELVNRALCSRDEVTLYSFVVGSPLSEPQIAK